MLYFSSVFFPLTKLVHKQTNEFDLTLWFRKAGISLHNILVIRTAAAKGLSLNLKRKFSLKTIFKQFSESDS